MLDFWCGLRLVEKNASHLICLCLNYISPFTNCYHPCRVYKITFRLLHNNIINLVLVLNSKRSPGKPPLLIHVDRIFRFGRGGSPLCFHWHVKSKHNWNIKLGFLVCEQKNLVQIFEWDRFQRRIRNKRISRIVKKLINHFNHQSYLVNFVYLLISEVYNFRNVSSCCLIGI